MTKNSSKISVIMPLYNAGDYVRHAIASVLNQSYENIELIIVNDGSTDDSLEIAQSFSSDKRIKIFSQKNLGACYARNKGLKEAQGCFIKFLDADDILYPDSIQKQEKILQNLGENEIVFGDFDFINSIGKVTYEYIFDKEFQLEEDPDSFFINNWEILISSPLHRKSNLMMIDGFDEKLKSGQESDLHFRLALKGCRFIYHHMKTFAYRSHRSAYRISVSRIMKNPDFDQLLYRYEKHIKLLQDKNGKLSNTQRELYSSIFFSAARKYFSVHDNMHGSECLKLASRYAMWHIPKFKRKRMFGMLYLMLGWIFDFSWLEKTLAKKPKKISGDLLNKVLDAN